MMELMKLAATPQKTPTGLEIVKQTDSLNALMDGYQESPIKEVIDSSTKEADTTVTNTKEEY